MILKNDFNIINSAIGTNWIKNGGIEFHWWKGATGMHKHGNFYEFFIILRGSATHRFLDEENALHKNDLVFIPPYGEHDILESTSEELAHINFSVETSLFKSICAKLNEQLVDKIENSSQIFSLTDNELEFILYTASIINYLDKEEHQTKIALSHSLVNTICSIAFTKLIMNDSSNLDSNIPAWLSEIIVKINTPEYFSLPLTEIYKLSNYSVSVFLQYFKKYTGQTLVSYMTKLKMEHACKLLAQTDCSILYISIEVGFDSLSHFNRTFKKFAGITPQEYRNTMK
ncbi:MAG: AraC family transcriptional regulator [Tyzzerella sp.]|nr:AraC family transcriptional regulator [Tyzzerella sp.]